MAKTEEAQTQDETQEAPENAEDTQQEAGQTFAANPFCTQRFIQSFHRNGPIGKVNVKDITNRHFDFSPWCKIGCNNIKINLRSLQLSLLTEKSCYNLILYSIFLPCLFVFYPILSRIALQVYHYNQPDSKKL